ncbi:hypothetical protein BCR36DRAFT_171573 [Piromyces finnis]|uniref:Calponin-homology (CH) domain-containing protein n=1 Tax=Piromyces finnis TaxID=1754191 RepID=A0A1Y1UW23_9FUNG|nr:hypothetical protein BCR36DRAFT_171573 [Piromyces finnis]|eukprot:ORX41812.1 hypothetical protein BCR36DRAFT_171573 [Piromyces finnis]
MIQSANSEEYDFGDNSPSNQSFEKSSPIKEVAQDESESKDESTSSSIEFLPGTSSRPLVLPTKSCVRKRGNRLSSAITERKTLKKVTSTLMEEPLSLDLENQASLITSPVESERKSSTASSKPQTPIILPKPQIPKRSSERKGSNDSTSSNNAELKARLEKMNREESPKSPIKSSVTNDDGEEEESVVKSPVSAKEGEEGEEQQPSQQQQQEEEEEEQEQEINSTLSRIHKIGRGLPSMLPEGGLSSVKLRSRREDSHTGGRQLEHLDENQLKQWILETTKKEDMEGGLFTILHDGQLLCELINSIRSDKQITPKKGKMRAWHIVNINAYLSGCVDLRIKTLFKAEDLYEEEGLDKIMDNLNELKFYADSKK